MNREIPNSLRDARWQGWPVLPAPRELRGAGPWVELSHSLHAGLYRIPFFPEPRFGRVMSQPRDPLNVTEIQMVCHFGTHVDAPCHFIPDGPAFDEIPLERLVGPGVVWRVDVAPHALIEPDQLERLEPRLHPGDMVLLDTGWSEHLGTERYDQQPSLSIAAARWLVERRVKLVGIDFATPDLAVPRRPPGFDWPVHHVLLSSGTLIAENLTNLRSLAGATVEVMFLGLKIQGADGAPARVIARRAA